MWYWRLHVDFQLTHSPIPLLIGRDEGQIVSAAQVVHQRLKRGVEILRLIRKQFSTCLVRKVFDVEVRLPAKFAHASGPNHDSVFQPLAHLFRNDAAHHAARFINRLGRGFSGWAIEAIKVARHTGDHDDDAATDRIAGADHVVGSVGK